MKVFDTTKGENSSRTEDFEKFAKSRADGELLIPPEMLDRESRRTYVRRTLREDHQYRIRNHPEAAEGKFAKLAEDLFSFFRGTALLYYRDLAGVDSHIPVVFTIGDIHPENFGVMPNEDDVPFFGVNDFDEAYFAPFTFDLRRGATGFYLAGRRNGFNKKKCRRLVKHWTKGYIKGLVEFARDDREKRFQFRLDNSPELIKDLIEGSIVSRDSFLKDKIDFNTETFLTTDDVVPRSKLVGQFQGIIDDYLEKNEVYGEDLGENFHIVKDVALKRGSGTASLGLERYWVLLQGRSEDSRDNIILEMKHARTSALAGLTGQDIDSPGKEKTEAGKIAAAHRVHLAGGDRFYGAATVDEQSFLVRERSPFKNDLDLEDLTAGKLRKYARICGKALAQTHARSDSDTGIMKGDAEKRILEAIEPRLLVADMIRFGEHSARRLKRDWKAFRKDHRLGAFTFSNSGE